MLIFQMNIPEARAVIHASSDLAFLLRIVDPKKGDPRTTVRKAAERRILRLTGQTNVGKPLRCPGEISTPRPGGLSMTDAEYAPVEEFMKTQNVKSSEAMRQLIALGATVWRKQQAREEKKKAMGEAV